MYTYIIFLLTYFKSYEFLYRSPPPSFTPPASLIRSHFQFFLLFFFSFFVFFSRLSRIDSGRESTRFTTVVSHRRFSSFRERLFRFLFFLHYYRYFLIYPLLGDSMIYNRGSQPNDLAWTLCVAYYHHRRGVRDGESLGRL